MKRWNLTFGLLAALAALCLGHGTPASADQIFNNTFPVSLVTGNCNGEIVTLEGQQHVLTNLTQDAQGILHAVFQSDIYGSGSGNMGNSYQFSEHDLNVGGNIQGSTNSFVVTFAIDIKVISHGPAPNFILNALAHMTFVNGQFTSVVFEGTTQCNG